MTRCAPIMGPFFDFVRASGMRLKECVTLRWSEVDFGTRQIVRLGKGGRRVVFPITPAVREILFPLQGQNPEFCFTYLAVYGNKRLGRVRGQRYPLTYTGAKTAWQRLRTNSGIARFHDFRHDFGTKLLRESGNLKLVQKALNHRDIKSTLRYAHVLDEDVAVAVERLAESRKKSRNKIQKVSEAFDFLQKLGIRVPHSKCRLRQRSGWWRWCRWACRTCSHRPSIRRPRGLRCGAAARSRCCSWPR